MCTRRGSLGSGSRGASPRPTCWRPSNGPTETWRCGWRTYATASPPRHGRSRGTPGTPSGSARPTAGRWRTAWFSTGPGSAAASCGTTPPARRWAWSCSTTTRHGNSPSYATTSPTDCASGWCGCTTNASGSCGPWSHCPGSSATSTSGPPTSSRTRAKASCWTGRSPVTARSARTSETTSRTRSSTCSCPRPGSPSWRPPCTRPMYAACVRAAGRATSVWSASVCAPPPSSTTGSPP